MASWHSPSANFFVFVPLRLSINRLISNGASLDGSKLPNPGGGAGTERGGMEGSEEESKDIAEGATNINHFFSK